MLLWNSSYIHIPGRAHLLTSFTTWQLTFLRRLNDSLFIQNLSVPTLGGVVVHMRLLTGRLCESTCTLLQSAGTTGQWVVTGWPATVTIYNRCTESIKAWSWHGAMCDHNHLLRNNDMMAGSTENLICLPWCIRVRSCWNGLTYDLIR